MIHFPFDRGFLWLLMACAGTLLLLPVCIRLAPVIGAIDDPTKDTRRIHKHLIPRIGGLAVAVVFGIMFMLLPNSAPHGFGFIAGMIVLTLVGLVDDTKGLSPKLKMLGHCISMLLAVCGSGLVIPSIPIPLLGIDSITNPAICIALTTFVGVGLINALNLIDGLDGLAAGIGAIASGGIAVLAALAGNTDLCLAAILLVGCLSAVLAFNSHPARIFLGDTGSMLIGYLLACFSIALVSTPILCSTQQGVAHPPYSPFLPLLMVAVPCADCLWVMLSRLAKGKNPFSGDKNHVHHHVIGLGLRHSHAVMVVLSITLIITVVAIAMRHKSDDVLALTIVCTIQAVVGGIRFLVRAPAYRRLSVRVLRVQRGYRRITTPLVGTIDDRAHRVALMLANLAMKSSFISLFGFYALAGTRPSSLMGWISFALLALVGIVQVAVRNTTHHFLFFAIFLTATFLALGSDLWTAIDHNLVIIGIIRFLVLVCFCSALLTLWLNRQFTQLVGTPLELLVLGTGIGLVLLATERGDFNVPAVAASSIAMFVVLKAMFLNPVSRRLPLMTVILSLATFLVLQASYAGLKNPLASLSDAGGQDATVSAAGTALPLAD